MAHTMDETQKDETQKDETRSAVQGNDPDVSSPALEPARLESPTHPALPGLRAGRLHFAPAPTSETDEAAPARRPRRVDWVERVFEAGWMALILGCAAECIYRLLWAVHP